MKSGIWDYLHKALELWRSQKSRRSNRAGHTRYTTLRSELLETRQMLSANQIVFDTSAAQIVIQGSTGVDDARISLGTGNTVLVQLISGGETVVKSFAQSSVTSIKFVGGDGDDYFENKTEIPSEASGDVGNDTLIGGAGIDHFNGGVGNDSLFGAAANDYLNGDDGNDTIYGGDGHDYLIGGLGNDKLYAGTGNDTLDGGAGDDELNSDDGDDLMLGGDDNDTLIGGIGINHINGGAGNDSLYGAAGNDYLNGDDGDDTIYGGDGHDYLIGGVGIDKLYAGTGNDTLDGGAGNDELRGDDGDDQMSGGDGDDTLLGGTGNDTLDGGAGNDTLNGESGNDQLSGGSENDHLFGNTGDDRLDGGAGDDLLLGDSGNDTLLGGDGADYLYGGDGADTLQAGAGNDKLYGEDGNDMLFGEAGDDELRGLDGNDWLFGGDGNDVLFAGNGDDRAFGGAGDDYVVGDAGNDELRGEDGVDLLDGGDGNDVTRGGTGDDTLVGGLGDDVMIGDAGNDTLRAGEGNDWLFGSDGDDLLFADVGSDKLFGEAGNDYLSGQDGNDELHGGDGDDWLDGGNGNDLLQGDAGIDNLLGGLGNDSLDGGTGDDTLAGEDGNDAVYGGDGADALLGGAGDDKLYGGLGNDRLYGDAGNDELHGDDGNDWFTGGDGDDLMLGDAGADTLLGGTGNDRIYGGVGDDSLAGEDGFDELYGDAGNDSLSGNNDADVLVGGAGNDSLTGNDGNDILIGGSDLDNLNGGNGDDLLIGGTTLFDQDSYDLQVMRTIWASGMSYAQRVQILGDEQFFAHLETEETVFDDGLADTLFGGDGQDWFIQTGVVPVYTPPGVGGQIGTPSDHHATVIVHELPALEGFALIDSLDKISDIQTSEQLQTLIPHSDNPTLQREHLTLFQLVRYDQVTNIAINNGAWSNPATWSNGQVPVNGAKVLIPIGINVTVDGVLAARIATVRVDGTLSFATTVNTELKVDTVVVTGTGRFEMGTATQPINAGVRARLLITDNGAIDRNWDPFGISRGLISHGSVSMYGAAVTSFVAALSPLAAGATSVVLSSIPTGWRVGDEVVLTGTTNGTTQNEVRHILSIIGSTVNFDSALAFNHLPLQVHVANVTRNAVIDSEATSVDRYGHVMFMHSDDVDVENAGFYHLGRTDKLKPINDAVVDTNWHLVAGTGTNVRGRYAVHFHRTGTVDDGNPAIARGNAVVDAGSWGFVNHSSFVDISDNVSFKATGSGYVTEAGDEIGNFTHNIAIGTIGSGQLTEDRMQLQDFGHEGDGFWFQGPGIHVTDNVSAANAGNAFIYYTRGLVQGGKKTQFLSSNLPDPSIANGAATIDVGSVPLFEFQRNVGYASSSGLTLEYHLETATHSQVGIVENSQFWNNTDGVDLPYSNQVTLRNLTISYVPGQWQYTGVSSNVVTRNITYDNLTVTGYRIGIEAARKGFSVVNGGYFNNVDNIYVRTASANGRTVTIQGPVAFGPISQSKVYLYADLQSLAYSNNVDQVFYLDSVTLNFDSFANQRVYYGVQQASAVPFPVPSAGVPAAYVGLTTQQLWNQYGIAPGGQVAPANTFTIALIIGVIAPAI